MYLTDVFLRYILLFHPFIDLSIHLFTCCFIYSIHVRSFDHPWNLPENWWFWPNGIIFHQPRFPWKSRGPISLTTVPFGGNIGRVLGRVLLIWPDASVGRWKWGPLRVEIGRVSFVLLDPTWIHQRIKPGHLGSPSGCKHCQRILRWWTPTWIIDISPKYHVSSPQKKNFHQKNTHTHTPGKIRTMNLQIMNFPNSESANLLLDPLSGATPSFWGASLQGARLAHFRGSRSTPGAIRAIDTGLKVFRFVFGMFRLHPRFFPSHLLKLLLLENSSTWRCYYLTILLLDISITTILLLDDAIT